MPTSRRSSRSSLLVLIVLLVVGVRVVADRVSSEEDVPMATGPALSAPPADAGTSAPFPKILDAATVCPRAGYLCDGLDAQGGRRLIRWSDGTRRIRIRISSPPHEGDAVARDLQMAAERGVRAWYGQPFPMTIDRSDRPGEHDIVVTWVPTLGGRELGRTATRWTERSGRVDLRVEEFLLATRSPFDPGRPLTPEQVRLTAAHEMGHALGLPHSDDPEDVMYPENTAVRLTGRDYRTMNAMYGLTNGAVIR